MFYSLNILLVILNVLNNPQVLEFIKDYSIAGLLAHK